MKPLHRSPGNRRRGFLSMELAMTLPILLLLLLGTLEFAMLFSARGTVVAASRSGARAASYPGATVDYVEQATFQTLGPVLGRNAIVQTRLGDFAGDPVVVIVRTPMRQAAPDLLWPIGFGLKDRYLVAETVMQRE